MTTFTTEARVPWVQRHTIVTPRLVIRPLRPADRRAYLRSIDEEVRFWQGYGRRDMAAFRGMFREFRRRPSWDWGCPLIFAVEHAGRFAGEYSLHGRAPGDRDLEIGWWLACHARGLGLGSESLAAVVQFVHHHFAVPRVRMGTEVLNVRAVRQIEGIGAVPLEERSHTLPNGRVIVGRWYRHEVLLDPARPPAECARVTLDHLAAVPPS